MLKLGAKMRVVRVLKKGRKCRKCRGIGQLYGCNAWHTCGTCYGSGRTSR